MKMVKLHDICSFFNDNSKASITSFSWYLGVCEKDNWGTKVWEEKVGRHMPVMVFAWWRSLPEEGDISYALHA